MAAGQDTNLDNIIRNNIQNFNPDQLENQRLAVVLGNARYRASLDRFRLLDEARRWLQTWRDNVPEAERQWHDLCFRAIRETLEMEQEKLVNLGRIILGLPSTDEIEQGELYRLA